MGLAHECKDWVLHEHWKQGIEKDFPKIFEVLIDAFYKSETRTLNKTIYIIVGFEDCT